jgi:tetratricopeptide (TPR) repeat protein
VAPESAKPARFNNLGRFLARSLGDYEGAVREYEKALALDSRYWPAHYNRLLSLASLKQKDRLVAAAREALQVMDGIHESQEDHPVFRSSYVHLLVDFLARLEPGKAREYTGKALDFLQAWVDREDALPEELNQYAWTLLTCKPEELQDAPRALEYAREAERISGGRNPEILDTLAEAYFLNGDATKALETGKRALGVLEKWPKDRAHREAVRMVIEKNLARYRGALDPEDGDSKG